MSRKKSYINPRKLFRGKNPELSHVQRNLRYSQTCLNDPLHITTSFVIKPYLFLPSVFPCIRPLYNDSLSNTNNDRVLRLKILRNNDYQKIYYISSIVKGLITCKILLMHTLIFCNCKCRNNYRQIQLNPSKLNITGFFFSVQNVKLILLLCKLSQELQVQIICELVQ